MLLGLALITHLMPSLAQADLYCSSPTIALVTPPNTATINNSAAVGAVLWTTSASYPYVDVSAKCGGVTQATFMPMQAGTRAYLGNNLYESGVPGVAYRITMGGSACRTGYLPLNCAYQTWAVAFQPRVVTIDLVKTGPLTQSGEMSGEFAKIDAGNAAGIVTSEAISYQWSSPFYIKVANPTCSVTTPNQTVNLDPVMAKNFTGVGSTAGTAKNFNISLNCTAGTGNTSALVYFTLSDANTPGNLSDMLTPGPTSTSQGVGMRIFYQGAAVKFGPQATAGNIPNTNQYFLTTVPTAGGTYNIPLSAQYVQTDSYVKQGDVYTLLTATFAYN